MRGYETASKVSRDFMADNEDISTVICAPVFGEVLGLGTEVVIGPEEGVVRQSSVRCDFSRSCSRTN